MDPDPPNQSVLSGKVRNMLPACLFVFMACLSVIRLVCYVFRACHMTSATGHAENVPDPMSCQDCLHVRSVTLPSCRGLHN